MLIESKGQNSANVQLSSSTLGLSNQRASISHSTTYKPSITLESGPEVIGPEANRSATHLHPSVEKLCLDQVQSLGSPSEINRSRAGSTALGVLLQPSSHSPESFVASIVDETRRAVLTDNRLLCEDLASMYRQLSRDHLQIQQLAHQLSDGLKMFPSGQQDESERTTRPEGQLDRQGIDHCASKTNTSDTLDVFFDCVSMLSQDSYPRPVEQLLAKFGDTPLNRFEGLSSFFPEKYTAQGLFDDPLAVMGMAQSGKTTLDQEVKFYLIYSEDPRKWRRIILCATVKDITEQSHFNQLSVSDALDHSLKLLPGNFHLRICKLLSTTDLFNSVTSISLDVIESTSGQIFFDIASVIVREDDEEVQMCREDKILQDVEDLGCPQYLECEIIVQGRLSTSSYAVLVEGQRCIERKFPFASSGKGDGNEVHNFVKDMKLSYSLRDCQGVARFVGIVLDDTRHHLKGYVYEMATLGTIQQILETAEAKSEYLPWVVRENWAYQLTQAMIEVHERNLILGVLYLDSVGLRENGSVVLTALKTSGKQIPNRRGYLAPELRREKDADTSGSSNYTFKTDVFQLGYLLWLLAEHKSNVCGYLCRRACCTNTPSYACTAEHTNPVSLPTCYPQVPTYFNRIIEQCRSKDPGSRPSARSLLQAFPRGYQKGTVLPGMADLASKFSIVDEVRFSVNCDECGRLTTREYYHCNCCNFGDFDLCPICVEEGIQCYVHKHRLLRRVLSNGVIVDAA